MAIHDAAGAVDFVRRHGVVLESSRGPVPNLAEAIAGAPIKGGWWGHPKGNAIFNLTRAVRDDANVLTCRLVGGKVTFVHRRLWPALVRRGPTVGKGSLASIREEHTSGGAHKVVTIPFPKWVPAGVMREAKKLTAEEAIAQIPSSLAPPKSRGKSGSSRG